MRIFSANFLALALLVVGMTKAEFALAQHDHQDQTRIDSHQSKDQVASSPRMGDPYPFDTCPITGKKLGAMGDPVVKAYSGREIRFCCPACPAKFEKDLAASLAKVDEKVIADQRPLYPLKTSVVSGKALPEKPFEIVYGNRLVLLADEGEKTEFLKTPAAFIVVLDKAVIEKQSGEIAISKCPVSGEAMGGDMGKPVNYVIAGRLIPLCCAECKEDVAKNPPKYIAIVDAARKGGDAKLQPGVDREKKGDPHKH